jgi:hypothetical protein
VDLEFGPGECEVVAEETWSSFEQGLWDDEGLEFIFTPHDCTSTIRCTKCGTKPGLDFDPAGAWDVYTKEDMESEFGGYYEDYDQSEPRSLQVHFKDGVASPDDADHSDKAEDAAVHCPMCGEVGLSLFGGKLSTDSEGGHAAGDDYFENPTRADFKNWDAGDFEWGMIYKGGDGVTISEWVNVGCSDGNCWSAYKLDDHTDVPAAILAAAAIASAMRSLSDMELLDLAAIAKDLDEDTGGLAEAAMTWIDSASNDAKVCEVTKEILALQVPSRMP